MEKSCPKCSGKFNITTQEIEFLEKISPIFANKKYAIPSPTLCPDCRQQRRLAWRNERNLYQRSCDKCKKSIIAAYPQNTNFPVYCYSCWWNDSNDGTEYGQTFNFDKPFFGQYKELLSKVPRINLSNSNNENCEYVNYTNYSKDCYLIFGNHESEKCAYCWRVHNCIGCFDCNQLNDCQYCYSCVDCDNCYEIFYAQNCQNCNTSSYLYNCHGLSNCFMCCNLINKQYCILNVQYSKEEYQKKVDELLKDRYQIEKEFLKFILKFPRKALNIINCENCEGDYLINSKNCQQTFFSKACQDCTHTFLAENAVDCFDCDIVGWPAELCYEGISTCVNAVRNYFSSLCWTCSDIEYCDSCFNSQNLFGCTGLKKKQYCILNKQYSKKEYEKLLPLILEHVIKTKEYGEFFPINTAPFPYQDSVAEEYFPSKTESLKKEKPFKMIKLELDFYKKYNLPLPIKHPDDRNRKRMALRNPPKLWTRTCAKCAKAINTSYAPNRPEIIYCEECYLKEIY